MSKAEKRLDAIRNNPSDVWFDDLCSCAKSYEFEFMRIKGAHHIYRHPGRAGQEPKTINLQRQNDGKAKPYQVKQFLDVLSLLYPELDL